MRDTTSGVRLFIIRSHLRASHRAILFNHSIDLFYVALVIYLHFNVEKIARSDEVGHVRDQIVRIFQRTSCKKCLLFRLSLERPRYCRVETHVVRVRFHKKSTRLSLHAVMSFPLRDVLV